VTDLGGIAMIDLVPMLAGFAPLQIKRSAQWPKNARTLSTVLRRITPSSA